MASITLNAYRVFDTPNVTVYVGNVPDRGLVCKRIIISPNGTTAEIDAPLLLADSDKSHYYMNMITVYADSNAAPLFRGFVDVGQSQLRSESVSFIAQSVWSMLRNIKIFTPESYNVIAGQLTTQSSPVRYFLADNPLTDTHECRVWQPAEIIAACYSLLDSFWKGIASVWLDSAIPTILPYEQAVYRMKYNGASFPTFTAESRQTSPYPDIVLRETTTFGEVMDFAAEMAPGTQVFEVFSNSGTDIYLAYPQSFGSIVATAGVGNNDWRDTGSNVVNLEISTGNGSAVNRVIARGAPASCVVTLLSETANESERYITGLVPDWQLYTDSDTVVDAKGAQGCAAYNYDNTCTYAFNSVLQQTVLQVMEDPNLAKPGQPDYIAGYEYVGRRYRLPNWFEFADIEQDGDLLIDQKTGKSIGMQVFFEMARLQGTAVVEETTHDVYRYTWFETKNFTFDQKTKTITLGDVLVTDFIGTVGGVEYQIVADKGPKLCRIAVTFTYSHPNYTLVADSLLDAGGVLSPYNLTAVTTGQTYDFPDESLGYTQISNIGMPLYASYAEYVPLSGTKRVEKIPLGTQVPVTYNQFIVGAKTTDAPNTYVAAGVLAYIGENAMQQNPGGSGVLATASILRDDSARLRQKCRQVQYLKGRKPRNIVVEFNQLIQGARRGMTLGVNNINYLNSFAGDMIDTVEHDLVAGYTTIRTTNQPADSMVDSVVSGG